MNSKSLGALLVLLAVYSQARAQYVRSWWMDNTSPVLISDAQPNNYAPANLGQLKWFATCAKKHLDATLPGGAGTAVNTLVSGFAQTAAGNYVPVNLGQIKVVAKPFYDRLLAVGYNTNLALKANGFDARTVLPKSGAFMQFSDVASGMHQHFFTNAPSLLSIGTGDTLVCWIYLDPLHMPREVMLQWNENGSWEHRAYWGEDLINFGTHTSMGALPSAGDWVRLSVPASAVGLENKQINGLAFTLYDGLAWWDASGKQQSGSSADTTWVDDNFQSGENILGSYAWVSSGSYLVSWTSNYPWDPTTPVSQNYQLASLGQLKMAFSFDVVDSNNNGTMDYLEGIYPLALAGNGDADGDGVLNGQDAYPYDSTRAVKLVSDANDHTGPTIAILQPSGTTIVP